MQNKIDKFMCLKSVFFIIDFHLNFILSKKENSFDKNLFSSKVINRQNMKQLFNWIFQMNELNLNNFALLNFR